MALAATPAALQQELQALEEERARWVARRDASASRLRELSVLLGDAPSAAASNNASTGGSNGLPAAPSDAAVSQSKQQVLVELKARTKSIAQRQKQVAETLAQQLRRLRLKRRATASPAAAASTIATAAAPAKKPKKNAATTRSGNKQLVLERSENGVQYPSWTLAQNDALDLGDASPLPLASTVFRIATRYLLRTGNRPSIVDVESEFQQYTGHPLPRSVSDLVASLGPSAAQLLTRFICMGNTTAESESPPAVKRWRPAAPWPRSLGDALTPRFVVSSGQEEHVASWLDCERRTVQNALSALQRLGSKASKADLLQRSMDVMCFLDAISGGQQTQWTLESLVFALVDAPSAASFRVEYTAIPTLTTSLEDCERRLQSKAATSDPRPRSVHVNPTTESRPSVLRPFDVSSDSVLRQLRPQETEEESQKARVDPMKTWCMFELSGVCNDESCPFQHERDLTVAAEPTARSVASSPTQVADLLVPKERSALAQLTQLCEELRSRWPTLDELLSMKPDGRRIVDPSGYGSQQHSTEDATQDDGTRSETQDSETFLRLGSPASSPEDSDDTGEVRYYGRHTTVTASDGTLTPTMATLTIPELEERVKDSASDVDAWLMLALRHLHLRSMMEKPSALIDHLLALSDLFGGNDSRAEAPSRANVEQSLHTLARALEVESNAYCDVLWWLHLRLGAFFRQAFGESLETITGEQDDAKTLEMEQVEQALEFVPTSVALWRHYLSLLDVGSSLEDATGSMLRLLQHLATLSEQITDDETQHGMSGLLCDLVLHVCSLYCAAGAESKAESLLTQLVAAETDDTWHVDVISCLGSRERVVLVLMFVHVSLTGELPLIVSARGLQAHNPVELEEIETLCARSVHAISSLCRLERAFDVCEAAMQAVDSIGVDDRNAIEALGVVTVAVAQQISTLDSASGRLATLLEREMTRPQPLVRVLAELSSQTNAVWRVALQTTGAALAQAVHQFLLQHRNRFSPTEGKDDETETDGMLPSLSELVAALAQCLEVELNELSRLSSPVDALSMLATRALARLVASPTVEVTYTLVSVLQLLNQVTQRHDRSLGYLDVVLTKTRSLPRQSQELLHALRVVWQLEDLAASDEDIDVMAVTLAAIRRAVIALVPSVRHRERLSSAFRIRHEEEPDAESLSNMLRLVLASQSESEQRVPRILVELVHLAQHALPYHERERFLTTLLYDKACIPPSLWPVDTALLLMATAAKSPSSFSRRQALQLLRQHAIHDGPFVDRRVLRWLVASDLLHVNISSLAQLLSHRLQANVLDVEVWRVLALIETLRSPPNHPTKAPHNDDERVRAWALTQSRTAVGLELSSWTYMDSISPPLSALVTLPTWRGLGLRCIPDALGLRWKTLRSLDLSANLLVTLPDGIFDGLASLEELDLSQNSLLSLPSTLATLPALRSLRLAHNHLSVLPERCLDGWSSTLETLDVRHNALASVSPRVLRLTRLRVLKLEGNAVTWSAFAPIALKMNSCAVDLAPTPPQSIVSGAVTSASSAEAAQEEMNGGTDTSASALDLTIAAGERDPSDDDEVEFVGSSQSTVESRTEENYDNREREAGHPEAAIKTTMTRLPVPDEMRVAVLKTHLPLLRGLGSCVSCGADNVNNRNQRLNTLVLCPRCLLAAVCILETRPSEDEETKGDDA